jgi:hypothetical protein
VAGVRRIQEKRRRKVRSRIGRRPEWRAAIQAHREIPQNNDESLWSCDPGVPAEIAKDERALNKKRTYPDIRAAESRYVATITPCGTLETSGQWRAVRVVPENVQFVDVQISGKISESTGAKLVLQVTVKDSTGRIWINNKRYESLADTGSYRTDAVLKARDPFQNVYSRVANDMLSARTACDGEPARHPSLHNWNLPKTWPPKRWMAFWSTIGKDYRRSRFCPRLAIRSARVSSGYAEEQYHEWRNLLHRMYVEESGGTLEDPPSSPDRMGVPEGQPATLEPAR